MEAKWLSTARIGVGGFKQLYDFTDCVGSCVPVVPTLLPLSLSAIANVRVAYPPILQWEGPLDPHADHSKILIEDNHRGGRSSVIGCSISVHNDPTDAWVYDLQFKLVNVAHQASNIGNCVD